MIARNEDEFELFMVSKANIRSHWRLIFRLKLKYKFTQRAKADSWFSYPKIIISCQSRQHRYSMSPFVQLLKLPIKCKMLILLALQRFLVVSANFNDDWVQYIRYSYASGSKLHNIVAYTSM